MGHNYLQPPKTDKEETQMLIENFLYSLQLLLEASQNTPDKSVGFNIHTAICEYKIDGKDFQLQLELVGNKDVWINDDGIQFTKTLYKEES